MTMKRERILIAMLIGLLMSIVMQAADPLGDSGLPEKDRLTWSAWNPYKPTDPLLPSGLLGPVRLMTAE
jgi:hypothetical protein